MDNLLARLRCVTRQPGLAINSRHQGISRGAPLPTPPPATKTWFSLLPQAPWPPWTNNRLILCTTADLIVSLWRESPELHSVKWQMVHQPRAGRTSQPPARAYRWSTGTAASSSEHHGKQGGLDDYLSICLITPLSYCRPHNFTLTAAANTCAVEMPACVSLASLTSSSAFEFLRCWRAFYDPCCAAVLTFQTALASCVTPANPRAQHHMFKLHSNATVTQQRRWHGIYSDGFFFFLLWLRMYNTVSASHIHGALITVILSICCLWKQLLTEGRAQTKPSQLRVIKLFAQRIGFYLINTLRTKKLIFCWVAYGRKKTLVSSLSPALLTEPDRLRWVGEVSRAACASYRVLMETHYQWLRTRQLSTNASTQRAQQESQGPRESRAGWKGFSLGVTVRSIKNTLLQAESGNLNDDALNWSTAMY